MALEMSFSRYLMLTMVLLFSCWTRDAQGGSDLRVFNVLRYGARPDGKSDNSEVFLSAWKDACRWEGRGAVLIPKGTYMLKPVTFEGPCRGRTLFMNKGLLLASTDHDLIYEDSWIAFQEVDGLMLGGGGKFHGQGDKVWHYNQCDKSRNCRSLSTSISLTHVTNSIIDGVTSINSKMFHFKIYDSQHITVSRVTIQAPGDSPNTDGISIGKSTDVKILNSVIGTGDDCISLKQGSRDIQILGVRCGPSHGISIGSLGMEDGEEEVSRIWVKNCTLVNSDNGVRIKTWADSSRNKAAHLKFEDITVDSVKNPIIIDQDYCPHESCDKSQSKVQISDVKFKRIKGTSKSKVAVSLICSEKYPCADVELVDIDITYTGGDGRAVSQCQNVRGGSSGVQTPPICI